VIAFASGPFVISSEAVPNGAARSRNLSRHNGHRGVQGCFDCKPGLLRKPWFSAQHDNLREMSN